MLSQIEAVYHCCTSYQWHFQQVIKRTPKKDKTNLRIDYGFLLVVISNKVLIVGIADSMCSSSDYQVGNYNAVFYGVSFVLKLYKKPYL